MLICILTKNVITSCSVTMMLFLHLEVKPLIFFSSRRRHTRYIGDWSSDVCYSDLNQVNIPLGLALLALTGIGPLIAWRRASVPNLQRQFAVPGTVGVFTALILLVAGMRDFYALMAIGRGGFGVGSVVPVFARGARAPHGPDGVRGALGVGRRR